MRLAVEQSVRPKTRLAIIEPVVTDDSQNFEIDPARERYAVFREIGGFLGRIEISHLLYIQYTRSSVKPWHGSHVRIASRHLKQHPL
jgi:hypothetical protein